MNADTTNPHYPLVTLDDLPQRRRIGLLWRFILDADPADIDALIRERSTQPCPWRRQTKTDERIAALGDDGRYHLLLDGHLMCATRRRPRRQRFRRLWQPPPAHWHEQWCIWWTDGTRYRIQAPRDAISGEQRHADGRGRLTYGWSLTLTEHHTPPELVPTRQRCPIMEPLGHWPRPHDPATPLGRIRIRLTEELGADCHACGQGPGTEVDHDPFTACIRGLVCRNCNNRLDLCPHLTGCPWADYLTNPPAAPLQLIHPNWRQTLNRPTTQHKIERLGFDPFAKLRVQPGHDDRL